MIGEYWQTIGESMSKGIVMGYAEIHQAYVSAWGLWFDAVFGPTFCRAVGDRK